jgi:hypothetical protein
MGKRHVAILLASERSGSTVFMRTLKNQSIQAIDEIFHPQRAWDLKLYPEVMRIASQFTGLKDSENFEIEASKFLRHETSPVDFLLEIENMAVCSGSHYLFSLFPSHLSLQQLAAICSKFPVLALVRSPIDQYISTVKASKIGAYIGKDTTAIKPSIDAAKFISYWKFMQAGYCGALGLKYSQNEFAAKVANCPVLTYESYAKLAPKEQASYFLSALSKYLSPEFIQDNQAGKLFQDVEIPYRQDRSDNSALKISNWESFISLVNELGAGKSITEYYLLPSP